MAALTLVTPKRGLNWPTNFQRDNAIKIKCFIGYEDAASDVPETRHLQQAMWLQWRHRLQRPVLCKRK